MARHVLFWKIRTKSRETPEDTELTMQARARASKDLGLIATVAVLTKFARASRLTECSLVAEFSGRFIIVTATSMCSLSMPAWNVPSALSEL